MTLFRWILKWISVLVAWIAAVPMYPWPLILFPYLIIVFLGFSFMGAFGVVFEGKYTRRGQGLKVRARSFFSCSLVQYSGVRVGMALAVAVVIHRASLSGVIPGSIIFGLVFIVFFLIAGYDYFSMSNRSPREINY